MIVTHDDSVQRCPGVAMAYREFFGDKPERVLP
jgi:hypothetical protein